MSGAIVQGLVASGVPFDNLLVTNRTREKADALAALPGVESIALDAEPDGNARAAASADIIVVGVKPAGVPELLREIGGVIRPDTVVVSVAAGVTIETMAAAVPGVALVRAMPNTPAIVRRAVTGIAPAADVTAEQVARVRTLFEAVGAVVEIDEDQIDALSTISGSGPAYVYFLIEEFTRAARGKGFSDEQAKLMAEHTFIGASALLDATGEEPAELRRRVTSPKGTTERAIQVFEEAGLEDVMAAATDAALARAKELAAGA